MMNDEKVASHHSSFITHHSSFLDSRAPLHGRWRANSREIPKTNREVKAQMRRRQARFVLLFLLILTAPQALLAQTLEERLKEIDEYAAKAGQDWKVPGFAV